MLQEINFLIKAYRGKGLQFGFSKERKIKLFVTGEVSKILIVHKMGGPKKKKKKEVKKVFIIRKMIESSNKGALMRVDLTVM